MNGTELIATFTSIKSAGFPADTDEFLAALEASGITDAALDAAGLAVCGGNLVVAAAATETIIA